MNNWYVLLAIAILPLFINEAFAQTEVNVTSGTPCFLNYTTTGVDMLQNCGWDEDYMAAFVLPFEWVTGGLFSMIVVIILIFMTWFKYHTPLYPLTIGLIMLPTSWYLFPDMFVSFGFLMAIVTIGGIVWYIFVQRTRG